MSLQTITIECPACGQHYSLELGAEAVSVTCQRCGADFVAETIDDAEETPIAAAPMVPRVPPVPSHSLSQSTMRYYYISADNQAAGPVDQGQLQELFRQGQITGETGIAPEGTSDWIPFRQMQFHQQALGAPAVMNHPGSYAGVPANGKMQSPKKVILAGWLMIGVTCLVALIPGIGFVTWLIAAPILLVTFILGIVALNKGATTQGVMILLASLIVAPLFLFVAPFVTTAMAIGAGGAVAASSESRHEMPNKPDTDIQPSKPSAGKEQEATPKANRPPRTASPKAKGYTIGDTVDFGDSSWVVQSARELGSILPKKNLFVKDRTSEGKFIYVRFKVTNRTNEEEQIAFSPAVRDSKGRRYEEMDETEMYLPEGETGITLEALPASLSKTFSAIFEVPKDSEGVVFLARSLGFLDKVEKSVALNLEESMAREAEVAARTRDEMAARDAALAADQKKLRESELAAEKAVKERDTKEKLAGLKGELATLNAKMDSERARYQGGIDTINRLTNFKKIPVQQGSQAYYQCLDASNVIKEVEAGAAELKAEKAGLEATIQELEK